jgi:hypothetical protein
MDTTSTNQSQKEMEIIQAKFKEIIQFRSKITGLFEHLEERQDTLQTIHDELIKLNTSKLFVFSLDSLQFQQNMIRIESNNMKQIYEILSNRLYGDYYKLYQLIKNNIDSNKNINKSLFKLPVNHSYPKYKDLDIYCEYDFSHVEQLFRDIEQLVDSYRLYNNSLYSQLDGYREKQKEGLNINNFVFAFENCANDVKNTTNLFVKTFEHFTNIHKNYLHKFLLRMNTFNAEVSKDIKVEAQKLSNWGVLKKKTLTGSKLSNFIRASKEGSESKESKEGNPVATLDLDKGEFTQEKVENNSVVNDITS